MGFAEFPPRYAVFLPDLVYAVGYTEGSVTFFFISFYRFYLSYLFLVHVVLLSFIFVILSQPVSGWSSVHAHFPSSRGLWVRGLDLAGAMVIQFLTPASSHLLKQTLTFMVCQQSLPLCHHQGIQPEVHYQRTRRRILQKIQSPLGSVFPSCNPSFSA